MSEYQDFLAKKRVIDPMTGLDQIEEMPAIFKPHQSDITKWALRRGRAAIFAGTGLGKTLMELEWSRQVVKHTGRPVLALAPLAVSNQHIREGAKFGIQATIVRSQNDVRDGTSVTNYQKMPHFDLSQFGGICLDESSILKSQDGHYRTKLINESARMPFRLAATATPAPNDFMELGNHAEFLGVMSYTDMLATFFTHDGGETQKWRLKGHAEDIFWKWMASWAVMLRKPSDLGYSDDGYDLPPLREHQHVVGVPYEPNIDTGLLFPMEAQGLAGRISARRSSIKGRMDTAFGIVLADWSVKLAECLGNLNTPHGEKQNTKRTPPRVSVEKHKVELPQKTKNICGHITPKTSTNGTNEPERSATHTMQRGEESMLPTQSTEKSKKPSSNDATRIKNEIVGSEGNSELVSQNMTPSFLSKAEDVQYAGHQQATNADGDCTSITATPAEKLEAYCAARATSGLVSLETIPSDCLEPWLIWCNLNSEQDALEALFGDRCHSVRGSDSDEEKERVIASWIAGERPVMISKASIMGFGLNLQFCSSTIFVGASDSFEQTYQAIRRFYRFGQTKPVNVHFIAAETEGAVVANYRRKERDADRMAASMVRHMADLSSVSVRGMERDRPDYFPTEPMVIPEWLGEAA